MARRTGQRLFEGFRPALDLGRRLWASRTRQVLLPIAALLVAGWLIHRELKGWSWALFLQAIRTTPASALWAAAILTPLSYACLAITEWYALQSLGHRQDWKRAGGVAFAAYALSNSLGFSWATGTAARLRYYSRWGLSAREVAAVAMLAGTAVSLAGVVTAGAALMISPRIFSQALHSTTWMVQGAGLVLMTPAALWFVFLRRQRLPDHGPLGPQTHAGRAFALAGGVADWVLSGAALYVLLPGAAFSGLAGFLAVFVLGSLVSAATGVPGGVGVFEAIVIGLSTLLAKAHETATALILYRVIYSLAPLIITACVLAARRLIRHAKAATRPAESASDG